MIDRPLRVGVVPKTSRRFFVGFAVTVTLLVLAGFTRTFFVPLARSTFFAPWFVYAHAACFFAWMGLLVTQSLLVASRRTAVHRRLGLVAFGLIPLMAASAVTVAFWSSARDLRRGQPDDVVAFFYGELMDVVLFATFATLALTKRRNVQAHKRLILLATLAILGAAVGRILVIRPITPYIPALLLVGMVAYDLRTRSRLHAVTLWGGLVFIALAFSEPTIGATQWWLRVGRQLLDRVG